MTQNPLIETYLKTIYPIEDRSWFNGKSLSEIYDTCEYGNTLVWILRAKEIPVTEYQWVSILMDASDRIKSPTTKTMKEMNAAKEWLKNPCQKTRRSVTCFCFASLDHVYSEIAYHISYQSSDFETRRTVFKNESKYQADCIRRTIPNPFPSDK
jgi:hypothetical protein